MASDQERFMLPDSCYDSSPDEDLVLKICVLCFLCLVNFDLCIQPPLRCRGRSRSQFTCSAIASGLYISGVDSLDVDNCTWWIVMVGRAPFAKLLMTAFRWNLS